MVPLIVHIAAPRAEGTVTVTQGSSSITRRGRRPQDLRPHAGLRHYGGSSAAQEIPDVPFGRTVRIEPDRDSEPVIFFLYAVTRDDRGHRSASASSSSSRGSASDRWCSTCRRGPARGRLRCRCRTQKPSPLHAPRAVTRGRRRRARPQPARRPAGEHPDLCLDLRRRPVCREEARPEGPAGRPEGVLRLHHRRAEPARVAIA